MAELHEYETRTAASRELAASIARRLREAIARRGRASLVVSGGSSPLEMFQALAAEDLAWDRVTVLPSDERWVATGHADSNEAMIRRELLTGPAANARFFGLYRDTDSPAAVLDEVAGALADVPQPLDVVVLGMGDDGHTASLFPHAPDIETAIQSDAPCVAADVGPPARLSLSLAYLCNAHSVDLLMFGQTKYDAYRAALEPGPASQYPVRGVLRCNDPVAQVHWAP